MDDQPAANTQDDAEPAHILHPDTAYVRGWTHAARATAALQRELRAHGLTDAFPYLRADVNVFGVGIIVIGHITPQTAHTLATLLAKARTNPHTASDTAKEDTNHDSAA